ncbi:MAG: glutathione-disulfide reductase [Elainellaceae cyanobacterium]
MTFDYDLLVIGGGSGGMAASKKAAAYGKRTAIVEQTAYGGTCVNRGCIPKKLMVYAADIALAQTAASAFGWEGSTLTLNWATLIAKIQGHVKSLEQTIASSLREAGVVTIQGHAQFKDPHTLLVKSDSGELKHITAAAIVLAVGGRPNRLDMPGADHTIVSSDMFTLPECPRRLAVMGGGYIGVEFSSILAALGTEVTLLDPSSLILSGFDQTLRQGLQTALCDRGITVLSKTTAKSIEKTDSGLVVHVESDLDGRPSQIEVDQVLMAVGRQPNVESLNLGAAGVELEDGAIAVDAYSQTTQDHIYAVGDCTNRLPLTPVAIAEGKAAVDALFGDSPVQVEYQWVPSAVFARPELASVGLIESEAKEKFGDDGIDVVTAQFQPLQHQFTDEGAPALLKLVADRVTRRVLGVHMMGEHAADIVQTAAIAVKSGITCEEIGKTIPIHPTTAEELLDIL